MSDFVDQPLNKKMNRKNLVGGIQALLSRKAKPSQKAEQLVELSSDLGDVVAGRFIAPTDENGADPTGAAFDGTFLSAVEQAMADGTQDAWLAKLVLGSVEFSLGPNGIYQDRLTNGYTQIADNLVDYRRGDLGMTTIEGLTAPSWGLSFSGNDSTGELLSNGGFETGDLTGWTAVTGSWTVGSSLPDPYAGLYRAECTNPGSTKSVKRTQTLDITGGDIFKFQGAIYQTALGGASIDVQYYSSTGGAGTLVGAASISTTLLNQWVFISQFSASPTSAQSLVLSITTGALSTAYFDSVSLSVNNPANYFGFEPVRGKLVSNMKDSDGTQGQLPVGAMRVPRIEEVKDRLVAVESTTDAAAVPVGLHRYLTTFMDAYGETDADALQGVSVTVTTEPKRVNLSSIPLGKWGTTARRIYRNSSTDVSDITEFHLLTTIADNTTTTYTDTTPTGSLSATIIPTVNTTGSRPVFPRNVTLWAKDFISSIGANYVPEFLDTSSWYNTRSGTAAADSNDGDTLKAGFYLEAGVYTFKTLGVTAANEPKVDYYIDGVAVQTGQDWYTAGLFRNTVKTFSVTLTTSGYHHLEVVVNGHNASSSDYVFSITYMMLVPAAY